MQESTAQTRHPSRSVGDRPHDLGDNAGRGGAANDSARETIAAWDRVANVWSDEQPQRLWRSYCDAAHQHWLEDTVGGRRFERALKTDVFDELAGPGRLARDLAGRAKELVQMDLSPRMLHHARAQLPGSRSTAADVRALPFADASFDLVFSDSTLDHLDSIEEVAASIAELYRVLRPGGQLLLTLDNLSNPVIALRNHLPQMWLSRLGLVPYPVGPTCGPTGLRRMLDDVGFDSTDMRALMHCPRLPAIRLAAAREHAGDAAHASFIRGALRWERLARWPTRYLTGYFVAASATRRVGDPARMDSSPRAHQEDK